MIFKVAIPGKIQFRMIRREAGLLMRRQGDVHYIGGAEVLPPPLEATEEEEGVEDLISIGTIGLIKSINTFNPGKNIKLATYASRCIENEILMYLRKNSKAKVEVSIDEPLNVDWDGNELLLSDILGTDEDVIYRDIENEVERGLLFKAVNKLSERERTIINLRFGLNTPDGEEMTQKEVAALLGISQSYISRLEKKIIKRLKKEMVKEV